jgi:hypothetical protein
MLMSMVEDLFKIRRSRFGLEFDLRRMLRLSAHYLLHVCLCFRHSLLKALENFWLTVAVFSPAKRVQATSCYRASEYSNDDVALRLGITPLRCMDK